MKRTFTGILAINLITISFLPTAHSAVKTGALCPKLGQKQKVAYKIFECVKVGKKFIWRVIEVNSKNSPGVPAPSISPSPSPSPLATSAPTPSPSPSKTEVAKQEEIKLISPWETTITSESLIKTAEVKFNEWWDKHQKESSDFHFYKNPIFDSVNTDWIENSSRLAADKFNYLRSAPFNVILSDTDSWAISVMEAHDIPIPPTRFACNVPAPAQCSDTKNSFFLIIPRVAQIGAAPADQFISPAHEYFHLVQGKLLLPARVREDSTMPAWFIEGSANFVGYWITEKASITNYRSGRQLEINRFYGLQPHAPLSAFTDNNLVQNKGLTAASNPYGIGMVACEYIVASSSFDALLAVFTEMSRGFTFDVAFEKSVGLSLNNFYSNFEKIRGNAGVPYGT